MFLLLVHCLFFLKVTPFPLHLPLDVLLGSMIIIIFGWELVTIQVLSYYHLKHNNNNFIKSLSISFPLDHFHHSGTGTMQERKSYKLTQTNVVLLIIQYTL